MTPKLHTIIYKLPEEIVINTAYSKNTGDVDLSELFKAKKDGDSFVFIHEESVRKWLSFVCGKSGASATMKLPFHGKGFSHKLNHILWVLPTKESCEALYSLLQLAEEAKIIKEKYSIINCYDPSLSSPEMIITKINTVVGNNPAESCSLTLTSQALIKDIQSPYWSGLFMLKNLGANSYKEFAQIVDLAKLPWPIDAETDKKESFVFFFSYKKALLLTSNRIKQEYQNRRKVLREEDDSLNEYYDQSLKNSPVKYWSEDGEITINREAIQDADSNLRSPWTSRHLINIDALAEFIKDKKKRRALRVFGKENKEVLEGAVETVQKINARIPTFLYLMDNKDVPLVVYLKNSIKESSISKENINGSHRKSPSQKKAMSELKTFEAITGFSPILFLDLADSGVLVQDVIDRQAGDFRASEIIPFVSSTYERAHSMCPGAVGLVFGSKSWSDFKYQYRDMDEWDRLLDSISSPEKEDEYSIRTITMLLCYLQLLKKKLGAQSDDNPFEIDSDDLKKQFLRIVSIKEDDSEDMMREFTQSDLYDLWEFESSNVGLKERYRNKLKEKDYLERRITDVRRRTEKMIEHYISSHSYNRYQRANEPYYSENKHILLSVPQREREIVIDKNTIVIGRNAFLNCEDLKRVVFPRSIQIIEEGAFHGCEKLETIEFEGPGSNDWQTRFDEQIKKVALNSFKDTALSVVHKDFIEKQYKTKPLFYQSSEAPNSVKVWCVDEDGFYMDSNGEKCLISSEEQVVPLPCIHSNFKDNEASLKAIVRSFLNEVEMDSGRFYDVAPIYLAGTEKEIKERLQQIAYLFCSQKANKDVPIGNLRFDEDFSKLISEVQDETVSKSSVGGTIYLSFNINSKELNSQDFADFLEKHYKEEDNVKNDLFAFCKRHNIGMTFYPNTGVFIDEEEKDPSKRIKREDNSYTIKIIYVSSSKLDSIAEELCKTYYQQSVLVEDEVNNRAYFKKHPLVQPNMDTLEQDNPPLYEAFMEYLKKKRSFQTDS